MKTLKIILTEIQPLLFINRSNSFWILSLSIFVLLSCGKEENPTISLEDGLSTVILDLPGDTEASMGQQVPGKVKREFHSLLFRFRDKRQIWLKTKEDSTKWFKSKDWDIAFTGPYNSEIYINNASDPNNPAYQGESKQARILLIKQAYQHVHTAPSDQQFEASEVSKVGWAGSEGSDGWYTYSIKNHLMQPLPNRTYVIRLPDQNYAKLQLINVYKGNPSAVTNLDWPKPYLTFKYYVQIDGSKNLKTN